MCGKSDKEAAPRVQRVITQLPGGVHGCTGVYSWGVYYPTDPPIQKLTQPTPIRIPSPVTKTVPLLRPYDGFSDDP